MTETFFSFGFIFQRLSKEVISGENILGRCIKVFDISYLSAPSNS